MSYEWVEELAGKIDDGEEYYACPGTMRDEWHVSPEYEELEKKAERAAGAVRREVHLYRLVNADQASNKDSFLIVKDFVEHGSRGEIKVQWAMVDTKDGAELMRDVSYGPTPFFGAVSVRSFKPDDKR